MPRGPCCRAHASHRLGGQPWPRPAPAPPQRPLVPEDAPGRGSDGAGAGACGPDRRRAGAGEERPGERRALRSGDLGAPLHDRRARRRLGGVPAAPPGSDRGAARRASTSAFGSCFPRRRKRRPSAPGAPPSTSSRRARWTSPSFPPSTFRHASRRSRSTTRTSSLRARTGHPFAKASTLARYCELQHLVVSLTGDAHGFVDTLLAKQGRTRRVAATVPNFMLALAVIAETDLISALPRTLRRPARARAWESSRSNPRCRSGDSGSAPSRRARRCSMAVSRGCSTSSTRRRRRPRSAVGRRGNCHEGRAMAPAGLGPGRLAKVTSLRRPDAATDSIASLRTSPCHSSPCASCSTTPPRTATASPPSTSTTSSRSRPS